jgi:4'-phosphopantetheinyl transferase
MIDVRVWRIPLDPGSARLDAAWAWLASDERERAGRFRFDRDRRRYVAARGALRELVGREIGLEPDRVPFVYGPQGKPAVEGDVRFNLSHSGEVGLLAIARGVKIGADVEAIRADFATEEIAERFFSEAERVALRRLPVDVRTAAFFACWTRKEAILKGVGGGLLLELDRFDVTVAPDEPARLLASRDPAVDASLWKLVSLDAGAGYAAAIAVAAGSEKVTVEGPSDWG